MWFRERALGLGARLRRERPPGAGSLARIQLERQLDGHQSCVNCLEWNQRGDLLASGSDDRSLIIWQAFKPSKQRLASIQTKHLASIFSVKFMAQSCDTLLASCGADGRLLVTNVLAGEPLLNCEACHTGRIKRLAIHPDEPHLIWSAGEDGRVLQLDLRERHACRNHRGSSLIDLSVEQEEWASAGWPGSPASTGCRSRAGSPLATVAPAAKCLALNPRRPEQLALGSNDIFVRLYDRRFLAGPPAGLLAPGHLLAHDSPSCLQTFGTTYLAFSADGSELLANMHAEQIYLFKTYEANEAACTFELARVAPLPASNTDTTTSLPVDHNQNETSTWSLPDWCQAQAVALSERLAAGQPLSLAQHGSLDRLLVQFGDSPALLNLRASALGARAWPGDLYQALRDTCRAMSLAKGASPATQTNQVSAKGICPTGWPQSVADFTSRFCGHCNMNTDIKEANFFGPRGEFIVAGSDDGAFYLWDKRTTNLVKAVQADMNILNCVQPHPEINLLATSGIDSSVKLWSPIGSRNRDVSNLETRCSQNQLYIMTDPLEDFVARLSAAAAYP